MQYLRKMIVHVVMQVLYPSISEDHFEILFIESILLFIFFI